jgi:16S rRNA processing protein RimM
MTGNEKSDYILVGQVVKPHGLKGEIKILPFSGDPRNFTLFTYLLLVNPDNQNEILCRVKRSRIQGKTAIISLAEISNRDESELQVGREVWARLDELPPLAEDEFYWQDLQGMRVFCDNGRELGVITNLLAGGAHDILVITGKGQEYMIPAVKEFMVEIDQDKGKVIVAPPPGLLDINL